MAGIPTLHDACLVGISLSEKRAVLTAKTPDDKEWQIVIHGVDALLVDEFRDGNVISFFEVYLQSEPPRDIIERLFISPHPSAAPKYHQRYSELMDTKCRAVEAGELVLAWLAPVYGVEVVVLGSSLEALQVITEVRLPQQCFSDCQQTTTLRA